jgi:hypothetical protein
VVGVMVTNPTPARRKQMIVRMDPALYQRFREIVNADHLTISQEIRRLIEKRIAEADASPERVT